jgi:hypothetical protein
VKVRTQHHFIAFGVIEKINVYVADRVDLVKRGSKCENSWKVVDHIAQNFLVFRLRKLHERFPKPKTVRFALEKHMLQFLVCLSHYRCCKGSHFLTLGCKRVHKKLKDSAALLDLSEL